MSATTTTLSPPADTMPVVLLDWRPLTKGALRGFARVRLGRSLIINDVPVLFSNGRAWASMPGKPILAADGTASRDGKGKPRYAPILEWTDRTTADRFGAAVIAAITRDHGPGALAEAAP